LAAGIFHSRSFSVLVRLHLHLVGCRLDASASPTITRATAIPYISSGRQA
jgi:hypothetical protein